MTRGAPSTPSRLTLPHRDIRVATAAQCTECLRYGWPLYICGRFVWRGGEPPLRRWARWL